jgi:hypothetical protein
MPFTSSSLEEISLADRERLARMVREQPTVTREAWNEQVKLFEKVGRDTESSLPFWRRFWKSRA